MIPDSGICGGRGTLFGAIFSLLAALLCVKMIAARACCARLMRARDAVVGTRCAPPSSLSSTRTALKCAAGKFVFQWNPGGISKLRRTCDGAPCGHKVSHASHPTTIQAFACEDSLLRTNIAWGCVTHFVLSHCPHHPACNEGGVPGDVALKWHLQHSHHGAG
jgi:hypothetical protein